ncbi:MAG: TRAP transporter small permease subunit [Bacteroidota bacterium]
MLPLLSRIALGIDAINEWVGKRVSLLCLILVTMTALDVLLRYAFNFTKIWIVELEWHMFALIFLWGAAYTFKHDRHVRVDVFYQKFSPRVKALINLGGIVCLLMPLCFKLIQSSYRYASISFRRGESSPEAAGLPFLWLIKFAILIAFVLLFLQAISEGIKAVQVLLSPKQPTPETS